MKLRKLVIIVFLIVINVVLSSIIIIFLGLVKVVLV